MFSVARNGLSPLRRSAMIASGSRFAEHDQGAAEAIDVGAVPRLARDQVFADDARLERAADFEVRVGELRLRLVHRRFEAAVDADFDQAHQRDEVGAHAGRELVQRHGRGGEVALGQRRIGDGVDRLIAGLGIGFGQPAAEHDRCLRLVAIERDRLDDGRACLPPAGCRAARPRQA